VIGRLSLLAALALGLAPGTWLRTDVVQGLDAPITLRAIDEPGEIPPAGWALQGVWQYEGEGLLFGGYSALLALDDGVLQAFSDRGGRLTFAGPDVASGSDAQARMAEQPVDPQHQIALTDIEAATRDPQTGKYWLAFEGLHAIQRYGADGEVEGLRNLAEEVDWPGNAGAEAIVRLHDGRFLVISEWGGEVLLYPGDPLSGAAPLAIGFQPPPGDFSITDAAELPDGRIMLLLRRVARVMPPFEARIAIADWPVPDPSGEFTAVLAPEIVLDLTAIIPPDNYEGLAVRERSDGALDIWVISDDNLSVMQRTLVAKLRFDPHESPRPRARKLPGLSNSAQQKARR
jgi:hypothetical protein